jgi:hypothetical protein
VAAAITDEHPADLIEQAEALEAQAEIEMLSVRKLRAEAAKLRARAERINTCTSVTVTLHWRSRTSAACSPAPSSPRR